MSGTFPITPVLRHADFMWFHERMRAGQEVFEFTGVDRETACHGYEISLWERGGVDRSFLAIKYHCRTKPESYVHFYRRRSDGDWQWIRAEEYSELDSQDFFQLMGELNDEQFLKGWQNT